MFFDETLFRTTPVMLLVIVAMMPQTALSQVVAANSGVPGDGIPDVYFFPHGGQVIGSHGLLRYRPAGTLTVDVDGTDMVSIFIGSTDVAESCVGPYGITGYVCGWPFLPHQSHPPFFRSTWEHEFTGRAMRWHQVAPENAVGFDAGVIGEFRDGFSIDVDHGLAYYQTGTEFTNIFAGPHGGSWQVRYATFAAGDFLTNVTIIVPEPNTWTFLFVALVPAMRIRSEPTYTLRRAATGTNADQRARDRTDRILRSALMRALCCLLVLFLISGVGAEEPTYRVRNLRVGDSELQIAVREFGKSQLLFCNLHDDEDTSVEAAVAVLSEGSGRLVEIKHTGERNCGFSLDGKEYKFDPNRIFTALGVHKTLEKLSEANANAEAAVARFGKTLLEIYAIDDVDVVIALHNNTDARYSAANYLKGNEYASDAADVFIAQGSDPDDFFFVTDQRLFDALKGRQLNVVLQNNQTVTDDGSLSVYCGQHGKPYVNVEAQHGHLDIQVNMLQSLLEVLAKLRLAD